MYFIEVDNGRNGEEAAHLIIYVSRPCECSKHAISAANSIRPPETITIPVILLIVMLLLFL